MLSTLRSAWESLQDRLFFLPPFPDRADPLALFSLLLVSGLILGELLFRRLKLPRIVGYTIAGTLFGPSLIGWITVESLAVARPLADTALGLLMLEIGRRLDLRWLRHNPALLRTAAAEASLSFVAIFAYATLLVGLSPAWSGAAAAITMASAPAVVLLTAEETRAQGQVALRTVLFTSLNCAISFVVFAVVLGLIHDEHSEDWLNAVIHPLWVSLGALGVGAAAAALCLLIARYLPKGSLAQVFVLVAVALLAVGVARMIAVPVFLSLFLMGAAIAYLDRAKTLAYSELPQGHWLLAVALFVIIGATLPWHELTLITGLQALGLLAVRAAAKIIGVLCVGGSDLSRPKRLLVGLGIQPLSATAVFMTMELATLYPEIGRPALALPLFAAALMEFAGPILCKVAFVQAGEADEGRDRSGGIG
jgi:Kef-type K+ transport system membrane component KefB